ncbi:UBN2_2 domain-containing protein [Cephalotus follicularis]|uniref:UBN2_2 domain-containing protein n=1 Tax=Cephalotus follicularis TaxID=3775 RepID=A0A1Q3AVH0_CEPFO|nr:UBN2_2 domain-containing protein [Cephalotus follicularis]
MKLSDRSSLVEHINNFTKVTNQFESASIKLNKKLQELLFLCFLQDSCNTAVQEISSTIKGDLNPDGVVSSIMDEEMHRKVSSGDGPYTSSSSTTLAVENRGRSKSKGRFS